MKHAARLSIPLILLALAAVVPAQTVDPKLFDGLSWRNVGPARGGRSIAVAGSVARPNEYYFGATGGGVWKTIDGGTSWRPVSDGFFNTATVGAIAVAPSNPDVVVAGTGERDIRGNVALGDGVYRTTDGGKTWSHIGLKEAQNISRIVIHPKDPDTIYVAALGHVFAHTGPNRVGQRGIFKTTDGGKTWENLLPGGDRAGAVHLELDPSNPDIMLASIWEAYRTPYLLNSGGPQSRLMKSSDGGKTWTDLSRNQGMPEGLLGKIGMTISPADPNRYYAIVEANEGGIFRSDDAGATWSRVNDSRNWRQRAWYYSHVYADPKNKDGVYVLNVGMGKSTDGGRTFSSVSTPHSDNHDLWIDPTNPSRMINANDGGANVSTDGGRNWTSQEYATSQFYHVSTDNAFPYRILGAQQDNSTIRIASRVRGRAIGKTDWTDTAGGESGYVVAKPNDPDVVFGGSYGGYLQMLNHRTGESRNVNAWPDNPMGHGAEDLAHRFQWTFPIVFSPHNPNVMYTCSQYVLRSTNGGQSWDKISPDLTRNDKSTMKSSGGPITKDNTSVEYYGTVFTLAESPKRRGVLWAGSDDGLIHVTEDGGKTWRNVTPTGMPKWARVSMIEASAHHPGTAYAAVNNYQNDDLAPYAYRTTDYGRTWTPIVTGIPNESFLRVIREDQRRPGLLYAGTETGVMVSFDNGGTWQSLSLNLPVTPVHDLVWKEDDLVIATHGRSFWVLDDISPLQQLKAGEKATGTKFFKPKDAYRVRWGFPGQGLGANPLSGVVLSYVLPEGVKDVKFEVRDAKGRTFQSLNSAPKSAGFNRTSLFLQEPSFRPVSGMILWAAGSSPIQLPPGEYTVTMTADGVKQEGKFRWLKDPRNAASDRDLVEQHAFLKKVATRVDDANGAVSQVRRLRGALDTASEKADAPTKAKIEALKAAITKVEEAIYQTKNRSGQDPLNYPIRLNNKIAALLGVVSEGDFRPTRQSLEVFEILSKELQVELDTLDRLKKKDLAELNAALKAQGIAQIVD